MVLGNSGGVRHRPGSTGWEVPGHLGAGPLRFPSVEPQALLRPLFQERDGESVLKNEDFTAWDLNLKVNRCLAHFAG